MASVQKDIALCHECSWVSEPKYPKPLDTAVFDLIGHAACHHATVDGGWKICGEIKRIND